MPGQCQISFKALGADPTFALELVRLLLCTIAGMLSIHVLQERLFRHAHKEFSSITEEAPEPLEMGLSLGDPHHLVDVTLVIWADSVFHNYVLDSVFVGHESPRPSLSLITNVAVEEFVSMNLQ